jgi:hypothetical protein
MPWLPQSALDRIRELEDAVKAEREAKDAQAREHARQLLHAVNMVLRQNGAFPIPPPKMEGTPEPQSVPRPLSPTVLAKYEAIQTAAAQSGRQMNDPDVVQWVKDETGLTPNEIGQRLQQQLSSEAVQ